MPKKEKPHELQSAEGSVATEERPVEEAATNGEAPEAETITDEAELTNDPIEPSTEEAESITEDAREEDEPTGPKEVYRNIQTPQELTSDEVRQVGDAILDTMDTIEALEEEKKRDAAEHKKLISEEKSHLTKLRTTLRSRSKLRTYPCRLVRDFDAGLRRWIDRDTGEEIETEPLLPEDHQLDLELAESENPQREADAEWDAWKEALVNLTLEQIQQLVGAYEKQYGRGADPDQAATDEQLQEIKQIIEDHDLEIFHVTELFRDEFDEELENATVGQAASFIKTLRGKEEAREAA